MSLRKSIQKIIIESFKNDLNEEIKIPIEIGDTVLGGKFKNKKIKVKTIDKNEKGDITINGKPLMRFRIIKENLSAEKKKLNKYVYHASNTSNRERIEKNGIVPFRGVQWLEDTPIKGKAIFATNSDNPKDWFDSTYDDDVWRIDTTKIPNIKWFSDPNASWKDNIWIYTKNSIPQNAIELFKKGTGKDMLEESNLQDNLADYKKWKRKNVTIRGVANTPEEYNGVGSISLGDGFYTAHLGNREMARKYGKVYFVVNGRPKNPLVFDSINRAEIWLQQNLYFKNYKSMRDFNAHTSIEKEVQKLGYDGIEIKGREMVNFKPGDIKFFSTERGLIDYYYDFIKPNQTT